jgi:hypothetical protein
MYSSTILDLATGWKGEINYTHRPRYSRGKGHCYPWYKKLGGPQSWSGRCGKDNHLSPLPGMEPLSSSVHVRVVAALWIWIQEYPVKA